MTEYLEPASDVIWGLEGAIITEEGEIDLQPQRMRVGLLWCMRPRWLPRGVI